MSVTARTLDDWRAAGFITADQHALLSALVRKERFSVFLELNALLYIGVIAIAAGIAWTVREHFASLGDAGIVATLSGVFVACVWYCATRADAYSPERVDAPSFGFDYVLYLGCLVFAADVTYIETRFRLLGMDWHYYLLASAGLYFALAYRFDNRFVLSLALSTLAAWFGVRASAFPIFIGSTRQLALAYGVSVALFGATLHQVGIKRHFLETYLHIAANAVLLALTWGVFSAPQSLWTVGLIAACAASIERGIHFRRLAFVAYGVVYGYVGLSSEVLPGFHGPTEALLYFVVSAAAVVVLLAMLSRRFGSEA